MYLVSFSLEEGERFTFLSCSCVIVVRVILENLSEVNFSYHRELALIEL